ncbi:hypothetical protein EOPP23_19375 [Endozoicomonas sp. OPT23]|uniref:hypothetical protein n=1 Tax=Endozoicomonas sp. OPT23 TaxID=2072845 RepID=UPI00129A7B1E|nr:hypothetical protein [Endozoicomonas sp. OPT23]MRI35131.1 hypothetical protein [Endozoicomonas sp. OPT23]
MKRLLFAFVFVSVLLKNLAFADFFDENEYEDYRTAPKNKEWFGHIESTPLLNESLSELFFAKTAYQLFLMDGVEHISKEEGLSYQDMLNKFKISEEIWFRDLLAQGVSKGIADMMCVHLHETDFYFGEEGRPDWADDVEKLPDSSWFSGMKLWYFYSWFFKIEYCNSNCSFSKMKSWYFYKSYIVYLWIQLLGEEEFLHTSEDNLAIRDRYVSGVSKYLTFWRNSLKGLTAEELYTSWRNRAKGLPAKDRFFSLWNKEAGLINTEFLRMTVDHVIISTLAVESAERVQVDYEEQRKELELKLDLVGDSGSFIESYKWFNFMLPRHEFFSRQNKALKEMGLGF